MHSVSPYSRPGRITPNRWDGENRQTVAIIVIDVGEINLAYKGPVPAYRMPVDRNDLASFAHGLPGFVHPIRAGELGRIDELDTSLIPGLQPGENAIRGSKFQLFVLAMSPRLVQKSC